MMAPTINLGISSLWAPWTSPKNGRVSIGESFRHVAFSIMFNNQRASECQSTCDESPMNFDQYETTTNWVTETPRDLFDDMCLYFLMLFVLWILMVLRIMFFFAHFWTPQKLTLIYFDKRTNGSEVEEPGLLQAEGLAVALVAWNVKKNGVFLGIETSGTEV